MPNTKQNAPNHHPDAVAMTTVHTVTHQGEEYMHDDEVEVHEGPAIVSMAHFFTGYVRPSLVHHQLERGQYRLQMHAQSWT